MLILISSCLVRIEFSGTANLAQPQSSLNLKTEISFFIRICEKNDILNKCNYTINNFDIYPMLYAIVKTGTSLYVYLIIIFNLCSLYSEFILQYLILQRNSRDLRTRAISFLVIKMNAKRSA